MIDLHLFLGRPLQNVRGEGDADSEGHSTYYGKFPQDILDENSEFLRNLHAQHIELVSFFFMC